MRYSSEFSLFDFPVEFLLVLCGKGRMKRAKLVNKAAEGPDVGGFVVAHFCHLFWAHIVRSTDVGDCHGHFGREDPRFEICFRFK